MLTGGSHLECRLGLTGCFVAAGSPEVGLGGTLSSRSSEQRAQAMSDEALLFELDQVAQLIRTVLARRSAIFKSLPHPALMEQTKK